jgi:hypothetical protein
MVGHSTPYSAGVTLHGTPPKKFPNVQCFNSVACAELALVAERFFFFPLKKGLTACKALLFIVHLTG